MFLRIKVENYGKNLWYHGMHVQYDYSKAILCSFCKITVNLYDSHIPTMISNILKVDVTHCSLWRSRLKTPISINHVKVDCLIVTSIRHVV